MNYANLPAAAKDRQSGAQCWICGATGALYWKDRSIQRPLEPEDLRITDYRYGATLSLLRCGECGFIFSNDKDVEELVSLYEKMSDPGYEESQEGRADIIEHVATPLELLRHCAAALAPQGIIIIVTPNVGSLVARLLGQRWWHFRLAQVGYFSHSSLLKVVERAGLTVVKHFSAKWFFRVSYLAERVESYLPVSKLNRLCSKPPALRWLYNLIIPSTCMIPLFCS